MERGRYAVEENPDPRSPPCVDGGIKGTEEGHDVFPTEVRESRTGKDRGKRLLVPGVHERNGTNQWNPVKGMRSQHLKKVVTALSFLLPVDFPGDAG